MSQLSKDATWLMEAARARNLPFSEDEAEITANVMRRHYDLKEDGLLKAAYKAGPTI